MNTRFTFNTNQRNGMLGLILIIVVLLGGIYWIKHQPVQLLKKSKASVVQNKVQYVIDSLKKTRKSQEDSYTLYPFNPNFISDYKGYVLGMSPKEIDRLHRYRAQDKWINSIADFKQVTKVSDSLLQVISPYFDFPDWVDAKHKKQQQKRQQTAQVLSYDQKLDLNKATVKSLMKIKGIGPVLARRIVRYRKQLGGFVADIQLKDIYGLTYERRQKIREKFTVKSHKNIDKLNLNTALTVELVDIYYIDYELARDIVNYRLTHEGINTFEELANIDGFPIDKMAQLKLYLKIEKPEN